LKDSTLETASRPLSAVSTAKPSWRSAMAISSVMLNSSSTTRTRAGGAAIGPNSRLEYWEFAVNRLRAGLGMPRDGRSRVESQVGGDLDRLHRDGRRRRRRLGGRLALAGGAGRGRRRGAGARRGRRVGSLGQPPELEEPPGPGRGEVGDAPAIRRPGRRRDP